MVKTNSAKNTGYIKITEWFLLGGRRHTRHGWIFQSHFFEFRCSGDRFSWFKNFGVMFSTFGTLETFLTPKQGASPSFASDTLHCPNERSLANFSDSSGSEVSRTTSAPKYVSKKMECLQVVPSLKIPADIAFFASSRVFVLRSTPKRRSQASLKRGLDSSRGSNAEFPRQILAIFSFGGAKGRVKGPRSGKYDPQRIRAVRK